jgi:HSP20 family protein
MKNMIDLIPGTTSPSSGMDIWDRFFLDRWMPSLLGEKSDWVPAFDIREDENKYVVHADLPGVDVKDLDVSLSDGILTVNGEKRHEHDDRGESYHRIERSYGSFSRSFRIPEEVNMKRVDASHRDGVLTITLPKAGTQKSKKKKIQVKS